MKIDLRITLDVDEQAWADEYGVETSAVRRDVREYVQDVLRSSGGLANSTRTVTVREERQP